jgi:hypothetical protein
MALKVKTVRIELLKHVLMNGVHTPKGTKLSLPAGQATEFVSCGQARFLDAGDASTAGGVRMEDPHNLDPDIDNGDPAPARRGGKPAKE